jgi:hypothetical protein
MTISLEHLQALYFQTTDILTDAACEIDNAWTSTLKRSVAYVSPNMTCTKFDNMAAGSCKVSREPKMPRRETFISIK